MAKRNLLAINEEGNGTLIPFPEKLDLPPHTSVPTRAGKLKFYKTDRVRTVNGETMPIYVLAGSKVDLDLYADEPEEADTEAQAASESLNNYEPQFEQRPEAQEPVKAYPDNQKIIKVEVVYKGEAKVMYIAKSDWDKA